MSISRIGPFPFITISRMPSAPNQRLQVETRAGVNGTAVWKVGDGGRPFSVQTAADTANFAQSVALYQSYEQLIGQGPLSVVYGGVSMPYLVVVQNVQPRDVIAVVAGTGGLLGTSGGLVRATWSLIPWRV